MKSSFRDILRQLLPALLLAGVSFALFSAAISSGHLQLDDWGYTAGCPFVAAGLSCDNLVQAFRNLGHGGIWMPLTYITYMADVSLFGGGWAVHHTANVALHALNAALAYAFLLALLRRLCPTARNLPLSCFLAALLWAVHPLRAEAVAWIASRKEELWTSFALLASLAWLRFLDRPNVRNYALSCGLFVLACLSKPTAICFPLVAFAVEWLVRKRPRGFLKYIPMLLVSAAVGLVAIFSQTHPTGAPAVDVFDTTLLWRLTNAAVTLGMYIGHSAVPCGIHIDYRAMPGAWPLNTALGLSVLTVTAAAVAVGIFRLRGTARHVLLFSAATFLVTMLPVLGIVGFTGDKAYADRYLYFPTIAVLPLVALALGALADGWGKSRTALLALAVDCILAAAALPVIHSFRNDASAYSRVLSFDPDHWRALRILGNLRCTQENGMEAGIAMLNRSLALRPSIITARSLAYVLAIRGEEGDFEQVKSLGRQIAARPELDREGMMLEALGIVAMREGRDADAVALFHAAANAPERSHSSGHALLNLGLSLANLGKNREAIAVLKRVCATGEGNLRVRATNAVSGIRRRQTTRFTWSAE